MSQAVLCVEDGALSPEMQAKLEALGYVVVEHKPGTPVMVFERPLPRDNASAEALNNIWTALGDLREMVELLVRTLPKLQPVRSIDFGGVHEARPYTEAERHAIQMPGRFGLEPRAPRQAPHGLSDTEMAAVSTMFNV